MAKESAIMESMRAHLGHHINTHVTQISQRMLDIYLEATDDPNPVWRDKVVTMQAGYADVPVPPGLLATIQIEGGVPHKFMPAQAVLHTARLRDLREDKKAPIGHRTGLGKGVPPVDGPAFGKLTSPGVEDLKEERKPSNPELPDQPSENRKQELSIKLDKTAGKKIPLIKERVRILSSGQPRVSSPKTLEIPLNLAVETAEKSVPLNINLLIKLE